LITGLSLTSFVYVFVFTALRSMGGEFEAAAMASGASPWRARLTIALPLIRPSILYAGGLVVLLGLGQFAAPLLLGTRDGIQVLTTQMFQVTQGYPVQYGVGAALAAPILVLGIVVTIIQRALLGDQRRFIVGRSRTQYPRLSTSYGACALIVVYTLASVVLPLLALLYVSLSPYWRPTITLEHATLLNLQAVITSPDVLSAITLSLVASALAVVLVLPLGFFASLAMLQRSRVPGLVRNSIELVTTLPLTVPAVIFGFALLFTYTQPPLKIYGTTAAIVLAYVTIMIPQSFRLQLPALIGMGDDVVEASRVCGAGAIRTFLLVLLPLTRRALAAATAIILVMLSHEFSASLMVSSAQSKVMGVVLFDFWSIGTYPQVAALALVMVAVTIVGVVAAMASGGRDLLERL
jgi:iron(III) transport system permease protein